jgi:DNA invertase Pin-like site-specific DNA recombinase
MTAWKLSSNRRSVAILRVSSRKQTDNTSHEVQEREVADYAKSNGLNLVKVYKITESARHSKNRKQYRAALDFILSEGVRHILFYMQDREARNLQDLEDNENLIKNDQIVIHYVHDRRVLDKNSPESEFFSRDVHGVMNKNLSRVISAKVKDSMRYRAQMGWFPGGLVPLGYTYVRPKGADGREIRRAPATIEVDPNETHVRLVRREFELKAQGYSLDKIRESNIASGLVPNYMLPTYHRTSIDVRLHNRFYLGKFMWEGVEYEGKHPLIIPRDLWNAVAASFEEGTRASPITNEHGIFSGFLRCADPQCGCLITYDPKTKVIAKTGEKKTYHLYRCGNGRRVHSSFKGSYVSEESLWEQFGKAVDTLMVTEELAKAVADELNKSDHKLIDETRREIKSLEESLRGLEANNNRIFDLYLGGKIDDQEYKIQKARIRDQKSQVVREIDTLKARTDKKSQVSAKTIFELCNEAKTLWKDKAPVEKRNFLKRILSNQKLEGQTLRYNLKKPFAVLVEMQNSLDWWAFTDSNCGPLACKGS